MSRKSKTKAKAKPLVESHTVVVKNVPTELLQRFDDAIVGLYATRSEGIRQLMRNFANGKQSNDVRPPVEVEVPAR